VFSVGQREVPAQVRYDDWGRTILRATLLSLACAAGLLYCSWRVHQTKFAAPRYQVEIVVHGPDGKVIPAVRHR
jgi:hypothetical protein